MIYKENKNIINLLKLRLIYTETYNKLKEI